MVSQSDSVSDLALHDLGDSLRNLTTIQDLTFTFLSCEKITDKGLYFLSKNLKRFRLLKRLRMKVWGPDCLSIARFYIIGRVLKSLTSLQVLEIGFGEKWEQTFSVKKPLFSKKMEGAENVPKWLKNCRHNLQRLGLLFCGRENLTDVKLEIFSKGLEKLTSLQNICLIFCSCKYISNPRLLSLCEGLEKLVLLREINFDFYKCEAVTDAGIWKARERLLSRLPSLIKIAISKANVE